MGTCYSNQHSMPIQLNVTDLNRGYTVTAINNTTFLLLIYGVPARKQLKLGGRGLDIPLYKSDSKMFTSTQ